MNPQAFDTLGGIPSHPLFVHLPVVLVPLAVLLMAVSIRQKSRTTMLWAAVVTAIGGLLGAVLAAGSGEALEHSVKRSELLREHTRIGDQVQGYVGVFVAFAVVALLVHLARTDAVPFEKRLSPLTKRITPFSKKLSSGAVSGLIAFVSVIGVVAAWQTYNAGHSGAKAVWDGVTITDEGHDD
jgi:uncharacterized membrane protein